MRLFALRQASGIEANPAKAKSRRVYECLLGVTDGSASGLLSWGRKICITDAAVALFDAAKQATCAAV